MSRTSLSSRSSTSLLETTLSRIGLPDAAAAEAARSRQARLTKPPGSLGRLEDLAVRIAGIAGNSVPELGPGVAFVMAADHGVAAAGVSAYPREVTAAMVLNFLAGGAAVNALAAFAGFRVSVTDCGVASDLGPATGLRIRRVRPGTDDITRGPAMSRDEARRSVEIGIEVFEEEFESGPFGLAAAGEMGIGNTTPASAIVAALTGRPPREVTGRGTGVDDRGLERKVAAVERALAVNRPDPSDPLDVLSKVGGFEIGAMAGVFLAAAARRIPVLVDGFISAAAALIARGLCPRAAEYMIAGHQSVEPGQAAALGLMGLTPVLDLGMRLGEGTGAVLAAAVCRAACEVHARMATFEEAGVPGAPEGRKP